MYRYQRLLVGLNNSSIDKTILAYAGLVSRMAKVEKIIFFHVLEAQETPKSISPECSLAFDPSGCMTLQGMEGMVEKYWKGPSETEKIHKIIEGNPLTEIIRLTREESIDLILVGRKKEKEIRGKLPIHLTRKAPCSVFIIPEGSPSRITNILVPVDFSDDSRAALEVAIRAAIAGGRKKLHALHVYQVPIGYNKSGKSYTEFAKVMKQNAAEELEEFIQPMDLGGIAVQPLFVLSDHPAKAITAAVKKNLSNLIVAGTRGKSGGAFLLLGSVTERLIETTNVPLLAVKQKGANLGFIDALLRL